MKRKGILLLSNQRIEYHGCANPKYQEILKLDNMLDKAGIYHELLRYNDGWSIRYYGHDDIELADVIEHCYSYGHEDDLLEMMGFTDGDVQGHMSAEEVFAIWKEHYEKTT